MSKKEWKNGLYYFIFAVLIIFVYKTIDSVSAVYGMFTNFFDVIAPFLFAILVAYILYIPCKSIENTLNSSKIKFLNKHSRSLGVFLTYLITILIIFIIITFVIPNAITSIKDLVSNIPNYLDRAIEYFDNIDEDSMVAKLHIDEYIDDLKNVDLFKEIISWINFENITSYIQGIASAAGTIFDIFVTLVVSIYMLLERNDIKSFLTNLSKAIFSKKTNEIIANYFKRTNSIFFKYIAGQLLDALIVGCITSIAMAIMGVKYGVVLGFMIGIFNIIPYFGAIFAVVITIIITIFTAGLGKALLVGVVIIALQQIDANIINPKILGTALNLSRILIIFAVTVGGSYFGVLGMFLGVPIVAFLKLVIDDFVEYRIEKKKTEVPIEKTT